MGLQRQHVRDRLRPARPLERLEPFTPAGSRTFDSQCDIIVPLDGADQWHATRFLYIGDRWNPKDLGNSQLVTLPIEIGDRKALLEWHDEWDNRL